MTSAATAAVVNIDDAGTIAAISGTATQGQVLTAGAITDADGGVTGITYQWKADGVNISGATSSTYTLTQAEVGKAITVVASYTDAQGPSKTVTSAATAAVVDLLSLITGTPAYVNNLSSGIQAYIVNHATLTAQAAVADPFGLLSTVYELKAGSAGQDQQRFAAVGMTDVGTEGATVTYSGYFKKSTNALFTWGTAESYMSVNLDTGTIGVHAGTSARSIESVGNGWYRVQMTFAENSDANTTMQPYIKIYSDATKWTMNSTSGVMNGTEGMYVYGMQLEKGTGATGLIRTTTAGGVDIDDAAGLGGAGIWTSEEVARGLTLNGLDLTNAVAGDRVELGYVTNGMFTSFATRAFGASLTGNETVVPVSFADLTGVQSLANNTQLQLALRLTNSFGQGIDDLINVGSSVTYVI